MANSDYRFIYTNDDVVGVSKTVSVGSTSLFPNTDYYVCNSDTLTKFKLSYFPSDVGISTIPITISNSASEALSFKFVRKEPVTKQSLINFFALLILGKILLKNFSNIAVVNFVYMVRQLNSEGVEES